MARIKAAISTAEMKQSEGAEFWALSAAGTAEGPRLRPGPRETHGVWVGLAVQKAWENFTIRDSVPDIELGYGYFNGRVQANSLIESRLVPANADPVTQLFSTPIGTFAFRKNLDIRRRF